MITEDSKKIWNRRYKAWKQWGVVFTSYAVACLVLDKLDFFEIFAKWSVVALVVLIGGLSLTDAVFNRSK